MGWMLTTVETRPGEATKLGAEWTPSAGISVEGKSSVKCFGADASVIFWYRDMILRVYPSRQLVSRFQFAMDPNCCVRWRLRPHGTPEPLLVLR